MALHNDYNGVENLTVQTQSILEQMLVGEDERERLCRLVAEVFTGLAGDSNETLQNTIRNQVSAYNEALKALKVACKDVGGVDGLFRATDMGQAMKFQGIGTGYI
ncbi:hypothetical protein AB0M45_31910 [Nocardia sp. NPDC051787]|uniref:hypothetical protein n=1 Tax=Nocardia sp. NPDC051787 TaxID=3155415 RepID=UPI00341611D3